MNMSENTESKAGDSKKMSRHARKKGQKKHIADNDTAASVENIVKTICDNSTPSTSQQDPNVEIRQHRNTNNNNNNNNKRGRGRGGSITMHIDTVATIPNEQHERTNSQENISNTNGQSDHHSTRGRGRGRYRGRGRGRGRGANVYDLHNENKEEVPVEKGQSESLSIDSNSEKKNGSSLPSENQKLRNEKEREREKKKNSPPSLVKRRNTENFNPVCQPSSMRIIVDISSERYSSTPITVRDIIYCPCIFNKEGDSTLYSRLMEEIETSKVSQETLLKSWHGDAHWIVDNTTDWSKESTTFNSVVERVANFFNMKVNATRFNLYKDMSEWKPFHHDAAALKRNEMVNKQNFTAAVSFGATRTVAFENAKSREIISFPQGDGTVYCIARDTNILWRHGILQEKPKPENQKNEGRISIILWGWIDQEEVS